MPEQVPNIKNENASNVNQPNQRKPAIRTMKSDVEELLNTTKPSLIQLIGQEAADKRFAEGGGETRNTKSSKFYYLIALIAIFILAGGGIYLFLSNQQPGPVVPVKLEPPAPIFAVENTRTLEIERNKRNQLLQLIEDSMREQERKGTIKRLIIKLNGGSQERFARLQDFFNFYYINTPRGLLDNLGNNVMFFVYSGQDNNYFGLAVKTKDPNRTWRDFISWENSLLSDLQPLFFDQKPDVVIAPFEDRTYRNTDWRFLSLSSEKDIGIGYTIFPAGNILILTTGREAMETVISRLFETK